MLAASSLECPSEIAFQNGLRSERCNTGGLPGERSFARSDRSDLNFFVLINTSDQDVLRRRVEFTLYSIIAPKGTSTAVIEALNQSMNSAVESAEFRQRIRPLGAVPAKPVNPAAGVIHLHPPGATSHGRAALSFAGHVRVTAGRCWRSGRAPAHLRKSG
jgi:hypothetical protein